MSKINPKAIIYVVDSCEVYIDDKRIGEFGLACDTAEGIQIALELATGVYHDIDHVSEEEYDAMFHEEKE
jgi:hypothetical protein